MERANNNRSAADRRPTIQAQHRADQDEMRRKMREESCLDPLVPLAAAPAPRPERGPTVHAYFAWKHGDDGPGTGRFYPLHTLAIFKKERSR